MDAVWFISVLSVILFTRMGSCSQPISSTYQAMSYLMQYNYLPQQDYRTGQLNSPANVREAIMAFQRMANINQTGVIDSMTMEKMSMPRCGLADITGMGNTMYTRRRRRRYTLQGSKWPKTDLTYKITRTTADFRNPADVVKEIERGFKVWSDVTPLTFKRSTASQVDIEIQFAAGEHGDGNPFDGRGRVLAHAYFPQFGGDSHFDEDEQWTQGTNSGTNLFQVAAHEFGHALGLSHSDNSKALMAPFYAGYQPDFKLHEDDVAGIQRIYGIKPDTKTTTPDPPPPPPPTMKPDPGGDPCMDGKIDAIVTTSDGMTYAFRGKHFYYLDPKKNYYFSKPMMISQGWPGLDAVNIDAAYTNNRNKRTYFFKGSKYWRFNARRSLDAGYPKEISRGFRSLPNDIDAAFQWTGNDKLYFIKGQQYWRYSGSNMDGNYPRPLRIWRNLPAEGIDAAFNWPTSKRTYFFKNGKYYRFNDRRFRVDAGYPKDTAQWWFECKKGEKIVDAPDDGEMSNMDGDDFVLAGVTAETTTKVTSAAPVVKGGALFAFVCFVKYISINM